MSTSLSTEPSGLQGRIELAFRPDPRGRTVVEHRFASAPFHLSKPYWEGDVLLVNCVNATAGVLAGDRLESDVRVERGARVLLTSPSAHRIHTMNAGSAELRQHFAVAAGGWLEVMPELFIPQRGCTYRQTTRIDVEEGGELVFAETLAPGRVAHGEAFAFRRVAWALDLTVGGRLAARERYVLEQGRGLWPLVKCYPEAYYAAVFVISPCVARAQDVRVGLSPSAVPDAIVGVTDLAFGGWVIKVLARDSVALRGALGEVRRRLTSILPHLAADPRKL